MAISEHKASSLAEILSAVSVIRNDWNPDSLNDEEIWFRGCSKSSYKLLPGIYRPKEKSYGYDEYSLITTFISLSISSQVGRVEDDWDRYFLAQHYRLPTRLLDWTESLLVAVYFAISESMEANDLPKAQEKIRQFKNSNQKTNQTYSEDSPAIWVLDAGSLNKYSMGKDAFYPATHKDISKYCWNKLRNVDLKKSKNKFQNPIAILPNRSNPRIVAQQGSFTIHGLSELSIDDLANKNPEIKLSKILLSKESLSVIWDELHIAGINRYFIYQDLDRLAEHIKFLYQKSPPQTTSVIQKSSPNINKLSGAKRPAKKKVAKKAAP